MRKENVIIAPSLLAADFLHLDEEMQRLLDNGVKWLHYDVMDGHFVPNISFGAGILKKLKDNYDFYYDVHIMVSNPESAAKKLIESGADLITFHYEATDDPLFTIEKIRSYSNDIKVGMSIKPMTSVDEVIEYLDKLDLLLVMSVEPGAGGQKFNLEALDKIEQLRAYIDENNLDCLIEVDGGINDQTGSDAVLAGADVLVSGTYIFNSVNIQESIDKLIEVDEYDENY